MSQEISTARMQEFNGDVQHLLSQRGSVLRRTVRERTHKGKSAVAVNQLGVVVAQEKQARHEDIPVVDVPHRRRWVSPKTYHFRDFVDWDDLNQTVFDPQSGYAEEFAMALGRSMDDRIIDAFYATAQTGEDFGSTTEAFAASQQVAAGAAGFTIDKLEQGIELLRAAHVDLDREDIWCALSAKQIRDLQQEPEYISRDFNEATLRSKSVPPILGVNFVHTERLPVNGSSQRRVPLYVRSGMHLGIWNEVMTPIERNVDKGNVQVSAKGMFGATRIELGKVVEIPCVES